MEVLQTLAVALGLAALSGYSFYLTVFASGLAIRFDWIQLAPQFDTLSVLGSTTVLVVSGVLFFLEFFVDKVPWVDSIWDAVHTIIRPFGGAFLAVETLGHPNTVFDVLFGIFAGSLTFAAHSVKAGTRLVVNQSPEPYSNIGVSLLEETLVVVALAVLWLSPVTAFGGLLLAFAVAILFLPRVWRAIRVRIWFIIQKLNQPAQPRTREDFPRRLPARFNHVFRKMHGGHYTISWAALCVSGRARQIGRDRFGYLVVTEEERAKVFFLTRSWLRGTARMFEIEEFEVLLEARFLFDELHLAGNGKGQRYTFKFDRGRSILAARIAADLEERAKHAKTTPALAPTRETVPASPDELFHPQPTLPGARPLANDT
ncbi:MAG TPA: DUF4126 domain-containing protein [Chthoniobacterales bacterium]